MAQHVKKRTNGNALHLVAAVITAAAVLCLIVFTFASGAEDEKAPAASFDGPVGAPKDMDRAQSIAALEELAGEDDDISYILLHEEKFSDELLMAAANNPEKAAFVRGYAQTERDVIVAAFSDDERTDDCPLLLQWDPRWGYSIYGSGVVGMNGCGPTCMAMVILSLTDAEDATPDRLARWAQDNDYYVDGAGTSWTYITAQAEEYDLTAVELPLWEASMTQALDRGALIVCSVKAGDFTTDGHYIVITGYDEHGFMVNDPNCIYRSGRKWSYDRLSGQISNLWAIG